MAQATTALAAATAVSAQHAAQGQAKQVTVTRGPDGKILSASVTPTPSP
jgi:hypothetical protein